MALANVLFDNREEGISIEETAAVTLRSSILAGNHLAQLRGLHAGYISDDNCFERTDLQQLLADFYPYPLNDRFKTLREYQEARGQDLESREERVPGASRKTGRSQDACRSNRLPERAMQILGSAKKTPPKPTVTPSITQQP